MPVSRAFSWDGLDEAEELPSGLSGAYRDFGREEIPGAGVSRAGVGFGLSSGLDGFRIGGGGAAEVADDAGGFPGGGEGGTGLGAAEAEDEAVHFPEQLADFRDHRSDRCRQIHAP